jgi:hypothetical protein
MTLFAGACVLACSSRPITHDAGAGDAGSVPPHPYRAIALAVGDVAVCVILDDHKVKCWAHSSRELGYSDTSPRNGAPEAQPTADLGADRTAKQLAMSHYGMCALLDDASVKCWGDFADLPGGTQIGDVLPVPQGRRVVSIGAGHNFPLAVLDDGRALVWSAGEPIFPDLHTTSPIKQIARALLRTAILFEDGTSTLMTKTSLDVPPPSLPFHGPAESIAGDEIALCGRLADGRVACEGADRLPAITDAEELALGMNAPRCARLPGGTVRCWWGDAMGCNFNDHGLTYWCDGQRKDAFGGADVSLPLPAVSIGAGLWSTCALLTDGSVWCWGSLIDHDPYGNVPDQAPSTETLASSPWLAGTVSVTTDATGRRVYAGWRAVDLGTSR